MKETKKEGQGECGGKIVIGKKKKRIVLWWQHCGNFFKIKQ